MWVFKDYTDWNSYYFVREFNFDTTKKEHTLYRVMYLFFSVEYTSWDLGVQQCFGVVYHELTNAKTCLFCEVSVVNSWYSTTNTLLNPFQPRQNKVFTFLLSDDQIRQNEA